MTLDSRQVKKQLVSKFNFEKQPGDHERFVIVIDGMTIRTMVSHGGKHDINSFLQSQMAKQLKVTSSYFAKMIQCTVSRDKYYTDMEKLAKELKE